LRLQFKLALLTAILIFVMEISARGFLWRAESSVDLGTPREGMSKSALGDWVPGQNGVWIDRFELPYYARTNAQGFRNLDDMRDGAFRILALGDSFTYGSHMSNHDIWTNVAEKLVASKLQRDVQILNNGLPGGTIADYLGYQNDKGQRLKPDLFLIAFWSNDISDLAKASTDVGFVRQEGMQLGERASGLVYETRLFLGEHSALYAFAREVKNWIQRRSALGQMQQAGVQPLVTAPADATVSSGDGRPADALIARFRGEFDEMVKGAAKLGSRLAVIYIPDNAEIDENRISPTRALVTELAAQKNVDFFDATGALSAYDTEITFLKMPAHGRDGYPADPHLSRAGNIVIGRAIADFLAGLLTR
jgi:lysophospholipase L1-like esterase